MVFFRALVSSYYYSQTSCLLAQKLGGALGYLLMEPDLGKNFTASRAHSWAGKGVEHLGRPGSLFFSSVTVKC